MLHLCVTALFYLDNSRKIAPACGRERECARQRAHALWLLLLYVFPPSGPALCEVGQPGVLFVLPEVLTPVLGPSFDLPLFHFHGLFPSLSFSHRHFGLLFPILPNSCVATIHTFTSVLTLKDLYRKEYLAVLPI